MTNFFLFLNFKVATTTFNTEFLYSSATFSHTKCVGIFAKLFREREFNFYVMFFIDVVVVPEILRYVDQKCSNI